MPTAAVPDCTPCSRSALMPRRPQRAWTPSEPADKSGAPCTAYRYSSRTTSTPPAPRARRLARWHWRMTRPVTDAVVVQRLRAAGAIVIAKSNLSEWANFRARRSSSGWSAAGGQCRNPHALNRSPGGSSSGSGAGVAAGLAFAAVGTETDGSILCPAALNGVVGIKPTVGLTSRTGVVPISASQDTVGPLARCVADAAALLGVLSAGPAGNDRLDPATARRPTGLAGRIHGILPRRRPRRRADRSAARPLLRLQREGRRARRGCSSNRPAPRGRFWSTLRTSRRPKHSPRAATSSPCFSTSSRPASRPTSRQGRRPTASRATVADLVTFNQEHARDELLYFGQDILIAASAVGDLEEPAYLEARDPQLATGSPGRHRCRARERESRRARRPDHRSRLVHRPRQRRHSRRSRLSGGRCCGVPGDQPSCRQGQRASGRPLSARHGLERAHAHRCRLRSGAGARAGLGSEAGVGRAHRVSTALSTRHQRRPSPPSALSGPTGLTQP